MRLGILGYIIIILIIIIVAKIYLDSDMHNLKCIISNVDGNTYCVRDRAKLTLAADKLASVTQNMNKVFAYCKEKYPQNSNVKRLINGYNPKKICETLPTSKYTAYSENKGAKLAFCLDKERHKEELIDLNTLTYVALHEMAHICTASIGHTDEFWQNFKFLIEQAKTIGVYDPVDYKKNPEPYCGMTISDNPYYDL